MKNNYKLWIILSLIVVFIAGVVCGVLIEKNILDKRKHDSRRRSSPRFPSLEMMAEELSLSAEQQEKIREVFHNNEERFKNLRKDMDERLSNIREQLLTPTAWYSWETAKSLVGLRSMAWRMWVSASVSLWTQWKSFRSSQDG